MRTAAIAAAAGAALAAAPVALAAQTNVYSVKASVSRAKKASKHKPVPVSVRFDYRVDEASGMQPAAVKAYRIEFAGLRTNGRYFKTCSAKRIEANGNRDSACSKKALVGTGTIKNYVYVSSDPSGAGGFPCTKKLHVWNAGRNKAVLSLYGSPAQCGGVGVLPPIPATFVRSSKGSALKFAVPPTVLHPIAGLTVAVRSVQSTIRRRTVRRHHRRIGYFEAIGGCRKHRREVKVTFTPETGSRASAKTTSRC